MPKSSQYLGSIKPETQDDFKLVSEAIEDCFTYHAWTQEQVDRGVQVRHALEAAFAAIIRYCPPSADRSTALRKIREARMDANSAITHDGKY